MDQRVGVDALHGGGEWERLLDERGFLPPFANGFRSGKSENRAQALTPGKEGVTHGFVQGNRFDRRAREKTVERFVNGGTPGMEVSAQGDRIVGFGTGGDRHAGEDIGGKRGGLASPQQVLRGRGACGLRRGSGRAPALVRAGRAVPPVGRGHRECPE